MRTVSISISNVAAGEVVATIHPVSAAEGHQPADRHWHLIRLFPFGELYQMHIAWHRDGGIVEVANIAGAQAGNAR